MWPSATMLCLFSSAFLCMQSLAEAAVSHPESSSRTGCAPWAPLERLPGTPEFQSQVGQDRMILHILGYTTSGFFVDLAANEPIKISNSYTLEKYFGWRGICIDGNKQYIRLLKAVRNCTVIHTAVDTVPNVTVKFRVDNTAFGGIVDVGLDNSPDRLEAEKAMAPVVRSLKTRTLEEILTTSCAPRVIDYLSLDVEGAEWRVLQNFPFHHYQFRVITVERPGLKVSALLLHHSYVPIATLGHFGEELWVHQSIWEAKFERLQGVVTYCWDVMKLVIPDPTDKLHPEYRRCAAINRTALSIAVREINLQPDR